MPMVYKELRDFVLQLLNRYSIAGAQVPMDYNDQADAVARIPMLLRDGLLYLATSCRRLRQVAPLADPEQVGQLLMYQLPDDCYQMCGGLLQVDGDNVRRVSNYQIVGGRQVLVPNGAGRYLVEYFRYPSLPVGTPADDDFLDCPPEAQQALAYYVASHLAMEDNNYLHGALYNEFEMKMLRLAEGVTTQGGVVEDCYG